MSLKMQAPPKQRWYVQIKETYKFASNEISFLALRLLGVFAVVFGIVFAIGVAVDLTAFFGVFAFGTALLATTFFLEKSLRMPPTPLSPDKLAQLLPCLTQSAVLGL